MLKKTTITIIIITLTGFGLYSFILNDKTSKSNQITCKKSQLIQKKNEFLIHVGGDHNKSTTVEELMLAQSLSDIIQHYPTSWINRYESTKIEATIQDKVVSASGKNERLSHKQIALLTQLKTNDAFDINVLFTRENSVTKAEERQNLNATYNVIPFKEAHYKEGYQALLQFITTKSEAFISKNDRAYQSGSIVFYISEDGTSEHIELDRTSGYKDLDEHMLSLIKTIDQWVPAENADGSKAAQRFRFNFGKGGC